MEDLRKKKKNKTNRNQLRQIGSKELTRGMRARTFWGPGSRS